MDGDEKKPVSARILFVCTGNSARSQMAEGLARALAAPGVEVASAGTHPVGVSRFSVAAMRERGIDISGHRSKHVDSLPGEFDYVITLCDDAAQECPVVQGRIARLHWPFTDPGLHCYTEEDTLRSFAHTRDQIEHRLREWLAQEGLLKI